MSPPLHPDAALQKTSSITKALRTRDAPLLSLLPTARELYSSTSTNIFFPRRDEWLLEWLVQRLKEDEGAAGRQARTTAECWDFLLELLQAVNPAVVAGTLKRHGVVPLVAKMMEEVKGTTVVAEVLDGVAAVLARLRTLARSESSVAAALRSTPEMCAGILGAFLTVCRELLEGGSGGVQQAWVDAVAGLWRGGIWGSANAKRTSVVWSERCLEAAAALLVVPGIDDSLETVLENMIAEYVFPTDILFPVATGQKQSATKPTAKELIPLLAPLKQYDAAMTGTSKSVEIPYLPLLFRIAINSQSKRRSNADAAVVEALFTALLSVVPGLDLESDVLDLSVSGGDIIVSLLQVLIETGTALPSAILSRIVTKSANLSSTDPGLVRWSLVETVLEIDFDTFLHPSAAVLTSHLFSALSIAKPSDQVSHVLTLVVDGFVKARDVMGFVERWAEQLKIGAEGDVWRSDALARVFAPTVEDSLTSLQIVKTIGSLREEKQWIILDAILRGLRREETEAQLLENGALSAVVEIARGEVDWRAWRLLARIGDIKSDLLIPTIEDAVRVVKSGKRWKEAMFASEVLMRLSKEADNEDALEGTQVILGAAGESLKRLKTWDGKITSVDGKSFGLAVAMAIVGGHLGILDKVDGSHRKMFVDCLFNAALAKEVSPGLVDARQICQVLVGRAEFYEFPAVKEAFLSALISNLTPFSTASEDMPKAIAKIPSATPENIARYEFIISCLQQYPVEAIKRISRERILDTCLLMDIAGLSLVRPLMYRLWKVGGAASFMATDPQAIKRWFAVPGVAHIFRRLLGHSFVNRDQEKAKEYLVGLLKMNYSVVKGAKKGDGLSAGELEMTWVVITELWRFKDEESINAGDLQKMRKRFLELLTKTLESKKAGAEILKYWREVWELERDETAAAVTLAAKAAGRVTKGWSKGVADADIVVETLSVVCVVAESVDDVMNVTAFAVVSSESLKGERETDILLHYKSMIDRLDIPTHREVARGVVGACFSEDVGDHIWELFKILINTIKKPDTPEELSASIDAFSAVHARLLLALPSSRSPAAFLLTAHCINTLLRSHPWTVIQHNLDTTLSSLTIAAGAHGPTLTTANTDKLYTSLTIILGSILSQHRHRIRGRYHLVVALLQTLLTILFTPKISRRKTELTLHPPWLLASGNPPLSLHAARSFARALQAFCDPPVSTVRTHKSELTESERSKERKMVGNVVGPVLECFVKRVLEERVDGAVRREVNIGVEKVLEVLGREGMKRVTGRMGTEARAVVRSLWVEFGRGRGERV